MLKLSDFLGTSHIEQVINPAISISHSHLTAMLVKAEKYQAIHDCPLSPCCSLDQELDNLPDLTSQPISESEEITVEDEMAFQQQEEATEQRADESDGSYQPKARRPRKKRRRE
jgi:hypothetical protein